MFAQVAVGAHVFDPDCAHSSISAHVIPSPEYPELHAHVYDPTVFVHVAVIAQEFDCAHSFTSAHVLPSPVKPVLHAHVYDPIVFVHVAPVVAHVLVPPAAHSSISVQVIPSPVYPVLHAQVYDPTVFVHVAEAGGAAVARRLARVQQGVAG